MYVVIFVGASIARPTLQFFSEAARSGIRMYNKIRSERAFVLPRSLGKRMPVGN